jgi:hypothetical protein
VATFPGAGGNPLGVKIELLLAGSWTDITQFVAVRNPVQISGMGRTDWTSTLQAATLSLTLRNDGRFTPKLAAGAYYPNITRNVQIRVSVNATSVTAVAYSGFRFFGEVAEWPTHWDPSGRDVWCDIVANGIWRRMSQLATTLGSAFTRYNSLTLTGTSAPRCYWPMEDGTGSGQLVSFDSVASTANAVQSFVAGQAGLSLAACTDFKGSDGIPQLNAATITATVPAGGTATNNCTRFLLSVPKAGDSAQGTTAGNLAEIDSAGTVAKFEVYLNPATSGTLLMQLRNSGGTLLASGTTTTVVKGLPVLVSCELTPSGANVNFAMRIITPGAAGITESLTGTLTTASVGAITAVKFSRAGVLMDTAVGHLSVTYGAVPLMVPAAYALGGYVGEFAMTRFSRICGEMGIAAETIGTASSTAAMGPQIDDTLTNVLQSVEDVDMGLLFESRTQFGLGYRSLTSMANQAAAATISYTANRVDPSLAPVYDDSLTRNNVTVTNQSTGYTQQSILTAGAMSVLNPPSGIGNGYAYQRTVNAALDSQTAGIATWLLNVGSVDEVRFPVVTMKMVRAENGSLFAAIPGLRPGDYLQITSPPSFLSASTIKQLAFGYTETMGQHEWTLAYNTVPESPYETGFSAGTVQTAQLPGSGAVTSTAPGAGGLGGLIQNGSITPSMLNQGITVKTLGGNRITISAGAPANPDNGDIWIASATGLISQWNGTIWAPFKFDASVTVLPGTVVAANIATATLTASLIAAGQVYAGFVDATVVKASEYDAFSTQGQFLAYDTSSPTTGHLVNSIAGALGTDSVSNAYPKGLYGQGLTLKSVASAPAAFSGSSALYTSTAGRLRYVSEAGADMVLDRSSLDLTNKTMGTQTTAVIMSAGLSYLANEAQVGSEFEIEIDGTLTTPTSGSGYRYNTSLFLDGAGFGANNVTWGSVFLPLNVTLGYTIRWRVTINTTGAGGTCDVICDGGTSEIFTGSGPPVQRNMGNLNVNGSPESSAMNMITTGVAIDTTANHTLAIYNNWSAGGVAGHSAITYRTRLIRRNLDARRRHHRLRSDGQHHHQPGREPP